MAIGIWSPVLKSTQQVVFSDRLNVFANKIKSVTLVAGTHMMIRVVGNLPVFIHDTAPANDAEGFMGVPVDCQVNYVLPRIATVYIYSPYENSTVLLSVGAMT